jgi:hypothetical protein
MDFGMNCGTRDRGLRDPPPDLLSMDMGVRAVGTWERSGRIEPLTQGRCRL